MKKAYYYATKKVKFVQIQNEDGSIAFRKDVSGKREARLIATESDALPWNF